MGMELKKKPTLKKAGSLVQAEARAKGQVKTSYYIRYFAAWGALMLLPISVLLMTGLEKGVQQVQNWWLSVRYMDFPYMPASSRFSVAKSPEDEKCLCWIETDMEHVHVFFQ